MARKKLIRFAEIEEMKNVFGADCDLKGKWKEHLGCRELVLELACAAGNYTLDLARRSLMDDLGRGFVGVDKKGDRLWRGASKALDEGLDNVAFLQILIEKLEDYFAPGEVDEIWITFPDPHPKPCKWGKRLCSRRFLEIYKKVLVDGGVVHLKTDNLPLFEFGLEEVEEFGGRVLEELRDIHGVNDGIEKGGELMKVLTYYEKKFMAEGMPIYYGRFEIYGSKY